jgi:hypothetical protein
MIKKKNLIFFQSSIELVDIINLVKRHDYATCIILVTGDEKLLFSIKKLNLRKKYGVEIYNFCTMSIKNPLNIFYMYFKYHLSSNSKLISKYNFRKAYYFNQHEDFVAPIFLSRSNIEKIIQIMVYEGKGYKKMKKQFPLRNQSKLNFFYKCKFVIYKFLQRDKNIRISLQKNRFYKLIHFKLVGKKIYYQLPSTKKFTSVKLNINKNKKIKKFLLYVDSNDESVASNKKFSQITNKILNLIESQGYHIIIKKHLRVKLSKSLIGYKNRDYILEPIPLELYDLNKIKLIMGLTSAAIAKAAQKYPKIKCILTTKLILNKEISKKIVTELNLISQKNKLYFLKNISDIKNLTSTIN